MEVWIRIWIWITVLCVGGTIVNTTVVGEANYEEKGLKNMGSYRNTLYPDEELVDQKMYYSDPIYYKIENLKPNSHYEIRF